MRPASAAASSAESGAYVSGVGWPMRVQASAAGFDQTGLELDQRRHAPLHRVRKLLAQLGEMERDQVRRRRDAHDLSGAQPFAQPASEAFVVVERRAASELRAMTRPTRGVEAAWSVDRQRDTAPSERCHEGECHRAVRVEDRDRHENRPFTSAAHAWAAIIGRPATSGPHGAACSRRTTGTRDTSRAPGSAKRHTRAAGSAHSPREIALRRGRRTK